MFRKLGEATQLLATHPLLAMVILTVWLPGNLLIGFWWFFVAPEDVLGVMRAGLWIEVIFGPIYIGGMLYALWQIKQGKPVSYAEAMGAGLKGWGRLFAARLLAALLIVIGLLALVVPGIILALRYALLNSAVIIEGKGVHEARRRSVELTDGIRLQILGMALFFYMMFIVAAALIYVPLSVIEEIAQFSIPLMMACEVVADCLLDVLFAIFQIAIFLFYWEQRQLEGAVGQAQVDSSTGEQQLLPVPQLVELHDDGNPYLPPQT